MTDEQIIKMLKRNSIYSCEECCDYTTAWCEGDGCNVRIAKYALELIHKQQAEIEQLKNDIFGAIVERDGYAEIVDTAVVEAIKEFAERLKEKGCELEETGGFLLETNDIDNLVKEMAGADNGKGSKNRLPQMCRVPTRTCLCDVECRQYQSNGCDTLHRV